MPDTLSSISRTHVVEEDGLLQAARPQTFTCYDIHVYAHALDFNFKEMCVGDDAEETGGVLEWVRGKNYSLLPWSDHEQA